MTLTVK